MPAQSFDGTLFTPETETAFVRARALMTATVAAYALMAHADGEAAGAERRRVFALLRENPAMTAFSREIITDEIAEHEANFRFDPEIAQQIASEKLAVVADDKQLARQVLAVCRALIDADGIAHPSEFRTLAEIKALLGMRDDTGPFRSIAALHHAAS